MTTETARFRFVVRFAGLDLDACRPGDLLNLKWDLRDFLSPTHADLKPGGLHTWPSEPPQPEEYSHEDFRALQAEVRDLLARVIASRANPQAWTPTWVRIGLMNPHVPALPQARPGQASGECPGGDTRSVHPPYRAHVAAGEHVSADPVCGMRHDLSAQKQSNLLLKTLCQSRHAAAASAAPRYGRHRRATPSADHPTCAITSADGSHALITVGAVGRPGPLAGGVPRGAGPH